MNNPLYTLKGIEFFYGETRVLQDISLTLEKGKFYTIIGPNGCGKTTLLDLLCGYRAPNKGTVELQGRNISLIDKKKLAQTIALVPQEFSLNLGFTVEEVVLMGRHPFIPRFSSPSELDWQLVNKALENIGLQPLRQKNANLLSGGQKQRTIVARALAQNSEVLLFDEATASLDIKYMLQIFKLAKKLVQKQGKTVIAVLHDINLASAFSDEIFFMKNGKIHCYGKPESVMTSENIKQVFGVDAKVGPDLFGQSQQIALRYNDIG